MGRDIKINPTGGTINFSGSNTTMINITTRTIITNANVTTITNSTTTIIIISIIADTIY